MKYIFYTISVLTILFVIMFFLGKVSTSSLIEEKYKLIRANLTEKAEIKNDKSDSLHLNFYSFEYFFKDIKNISAKRFGVFNLSGRTRTDEYSGWKNISSKLIVDFIDNEFLEISDLQFGMLNSKIIDFYINDKAGFTAKLLNSIKLSEIQAEYMDTSGMARFYSYLPISKSNFLKEIIRRNAEYNDTLKLNNNGIEVVFNFDTKGEISSITDDIIRPTKFGYTKAEHITKFSFDKKNNEESFPVKVTYSWKYNGKEFIYKELKLLEYSITNNL